MGKLITDHIIRTLQVEERTEYLFEGISVKRTSFGTDIPLFQNSETMTSDESVRFAKFKSGFGKELIYTFFKIDNGVVGVLFIKGEHGYSLNFSTYKGDLSKIGGIFDLVQAMSLVPSSESGNAFDVFGKVIFVASFVAKQQKIKTFLVEPTNQTKALYDKLKKSQVFKSVLQKLGYKLISKEFGFQIKNI